MTRKLTKPQNKMLVRAMRENVPLAGSSYRVAGRLSALGYGEVRNQAFCATRAGLEALLYDRKLDDCYKGSMATMERVREVEAALNEFGA